MKEAESFKQGFSVADLKQFLPYIRKNWWLVLLFIALSFIVGKIYVYKLDKIYSVSTQLLLKQNDDYSSGNLITGNSGKFYGNAYGTFVDNSNEIKVIMSHDLIEKALDRLDFDVSYYLVGRLRTTEVYSGVPFFVKTRSMNPELYEQQIKFKVIDQKKYELSFLIGDKTISVKGDFDEELVNEYMSLTVFKKNQAIGKEANYMIQPHKKSTLSAQILSRLKVENPDYTNVLKVTYQDVLTERAVRFLDTLSQVYIENSLESRLELNRNTLFYIDRQMDEVVNILNNIEDSLRRFRQYYSVFDLAKQSDQYFERYSDNLDERKNIELKLKTLDDLEEYVIENKDPAFLPPAAYILAGDNFQIATMSALYEKQLMLNAELQQAHLASFTIKNLKNQIDSTKRDLLIYIKNTRVALNQRIKEIEDNISYYDGELEQVPLKQQGLLNIQRKQRVNEEMYLFLLQRRANTIISRASIVPETKVIERPRFNGIITPDDGKILYTITVSGALIALLIVFIRILFFHRIESYEELKSKTHLPIVGDIVYTKTDSDLVIAVESDPKSPLTESFRTVRTNLQYVATAEGAHVILVTSNSPGEGKTFCSLNIASVFAKSGKRTIILEMDLHKPRVHRGLKLESSKGISTLAAGKNSIAECVLQTHIENLDTILSGPLPPNPSEIVSSKFMDDILDYCKERYQYVIIDTPPVGLITDALAIIPKAEVLLFVVNTKFAFRHSLENAHEIARINPSTHFGFILNGVKRRKSKYYYNRYSYGYGYGYGSYGQGGYGGYGGGSYGSYGGYGTSSKKKKSEN